MADIPVTGKLDEISSLIGGLQADMRNILRSIDRDRDTSDTRHKENSGRLDKIEDALAPLKVTVDDLKPIVEQYRIASWKIAGAMTLGSSLLVGVGWVVTHFAGVALKGWPLVK